MQKSIIDRVFPLAKGSVPEYEQTQPLAGERSWSSTPSPRISLRQNVNTSDEGTIPQALSDHLGFSTPPFQGTRNQVLQLAPLSASVLHHNDPFLPVERAARALEETIQSLLDMQSCALNGRMNGQDGGDGISAGSLTPTQSVATPRSGPGVRTVPIRQPVQKKMSLRGARKGLARKMREFADLKAEELHILEMQTDTRNNALERVEELEKRRDACTVEIAAIRQEDTTSAAASLRREAVNVEHDIQELEHRLLELRVRHRHLLNKADQVQSSQDSKISSYEGTIRLIDRESRDFLRRPPVPQALADGSDQKRSGMYALKPDRRTLEMAREQWTAEREVLADRKVEVETERVALVEGERIWSSAVQRIDSFERSLRAQTAQLIEHPSGSLSGSMQTVLTQLYTTISSLESDLAVAESRQWNLLICALGAELEAFHQARGMLEDTQQKANDAAFGDTDHSDGSDDEQLGQGMSDARGISSPHGSPGSNQSLKDTLEVFGKSSNHTAHLHSKYESEDDEPPADFFLSH